MTRKFKVAYILHRFPYLTETFIMREIYWLQRQGIDVEIFSLLSPKHSVVHEQAQELLSVTHYSPFVSWDVLKSQVYFLARSPGRYMRAFFNLMRQTIREPGVLLRALVLFPKSIYFARLIQQKKMDHMHSHFVWIDAIAAGVAHDVLGITFTIHPHAFGLFGRNQKSVKCELEHATQIVTISEFHRDYIQRLCPGISREHINVVYCALETDLYQPVRRTKEDGPIQILSVGRMIEKKGFQYLIAACKRLADAGVDFKCVIIGGGTLKESLQNEIDKFGLQNQVQLMGSMSQTQVLEFYHKTDIFALPCVVAGDGDRDGIPVVLMEAMACGIPVVTTPVTGIPDLVQHEQTGLMVAERDVDALTAALEKLISEPNVRQQLGRQGRQIIMDKFDIRKNTAQLASIFKRVSNSWVAPTPSEDLVGTSVNSTPLKQKTHT